MCSRCRDVHNIAITAAIYFRRAAVYDQACVSLELAKFLFAVPAQEALPRALLFEALSALRHKAKDVVAMLFVVHHAV